MPEVELEQIEMSAPRRVRRVKIEVTLVYFMRSPVGAVGHETS